jgi:hypothetical protein
MSYAAYSPLPLSCLRRTVQAFIPFRTTMPSADSSRLIRPDHSTLRLEFNINRRPPEVSSTVFSERPADLQPVPLMEKDFAVHCQFDRHSMPHIRFLSIGPGFCSTLPSDPASRDDALALHSDFTPSGCQRDLHPQAVEHARRTTKKPGSE